MIRKPIRNRSNPLGKDSHGKKNTRQNKETDFVTLLNLIVDPSVIVDAKGNFLVVNKAFEDVIGKSPKN